LPFNSTQHIDFVNQIAEFEDQYVFKDKYSVKMKKEASWSDSDFFH